MAGRHVRKQWGEANDVEVKIDHINNALLYSTGAAEVAAQSGHDLFWFISPPSTFQKQAIPVTDLVQEVSKKVGRMSRVARKSTYNPTTKQFYGFPESYAPDPVQYRRSQLQQAGVSLRTWDDLRKGAAKLKAVGHPVGLGMSNEIDSNMLLTSLLYCYGGYIQNEDNRIVIGQGANRKGAIQALQVMKRHLPERHVGRGLRLDRRVEQPGLPRRPAVGGAQRDLDRPLGRGLREPGLSDDTWLSSIPRGPHAPGQRARDGRLRDLEVREEQGGGEEVPRRPAARLPRALRSQPVLQLPAVDGRDQGRLQGDPHRCPRRTRTSREGKYTVLTTIAEKYTTNPGHPGNTTPVMDEIYNTFLIPQMFAEVAQGKSTPADAVSSLREQGTGHLPEVEEPEAALFLRRTNRPKVSERLSAWLPVLCVPPRTAPRR